MADLDPTQSTLSPNFAQYVYNMLGKGEAAANLPFQEFTGQRFAAASPLQQQAFTGISGLGTPSQFGTATQLATQAGQGVGAYTPTQFGSTYAAPGVSGATQFGNMFQAPGAYQAPALSGTTQFTNQFQPPGAYQAGQFSTGLGAIGSVQDYMNPYMSGVTDIAAREARRQADIGRQAEQARLAQAGAYGGSRQAIMEAERQRNLNQQIGDITEKGLQSAYDRALAQRTQEAQMGLQAQQMGEQSRQFGAGQGMQAAQLAAQYGLGAQQAQEAARQFQEQQRARGAEFGATQAMQGAQLGAQFGLEGLRAQEAARQFQEQQRGQQAQLGAQYGLEAQKASEASKQFGANLGLQGLAQQLQAAQTLGSLGAQQFSTGLQGLQTQLGAGAQQRAIEQEPLDFGYQQFQESMKYPYQQATYMQGLLQGLPLQARAPEQGQSGLAAALSGGLSGLALYKSLFGG